MPGGDVRREQLDRDRPVEAYLTGPEDEPHSPWPSADSSEHLPASACCSARKLSSAGHIHDGMAQCGALTPLP